MVNVYKTLFDKRENKLNYYRGKDCAENLCKKLKESAMEKINYAEKEMIPLTHEENDTHFILEQLAKELKGELNCIGDNMRISLFQSQLKKKLIMMMVMMVKKRKQLHTN